MYILPWFFRVPEIEKALENTVVYVARRPGFIAAFPFQCQW